MTDLKISQFADGGPIAETDQIAAVRSGVNTKVFVGSMAAEDKDDYATTTDLSNLASSLAPVATSGEAVDVSYNNATSGLSATQVQAAIDELAGATGVPDGDKGDIIVSSSGTVWTIDNGVVTGAKLGAISSAQLLAAMSDETGTGALVFADSPALVGTPTAPTAAAATNTTQVATTAFVQSALSSSSAISGVMLASNFSKTHDTTIATITSFSIPVVNANTYRFSVFLDTTSNTAGGIKVIMNGSTATSSAYRSICTVWNGSTPTVSTNANSSLGGAFEYAVTAVTAAKVLIEGTFRCSATGSLLVQFAQNASNATASVVLAGSYFTVQRIV